MMMHWPSVMMIVVIAVVMVIAMMIVSVMCMPVIITMRMMHWRPRRVVYSVMGRQRGSWRLTKCKKRTEYQER